MRQDGPFWTKPKIRVAIAVAASLSALALAVVIGAIANRLSYAPQRVEASEDTFARSADPKAPAGELGYLAAGGLQGGAAITYLKFNIDLPSEKKLAKAWLWLGRVEDAPLPDAVELTHVPDTTWREGAVTAQSAPRMGTVVGTLNPRRKDPAIVFDVTRVIGQSGRYAFAVTVPSSVDSAKFVARESATSEIGAPTITLEWQVEPSGTEVSASDGPMTSDSPSFSPWPSASPSTVTSASPSPSSSAQPTPSWASPSPSTSVPPECVVGPTLVPNCGALWGVAPAAHTGLPRMTALTDFEKLVGRPQRIYHAYHRGTQLFPTPTEIRMAKDRRNPRILFLNWKPLGATWAQIAAGHRPTDYYLDRLAEHIKANFTDPFYFTMHHEPENDVREQWGSGMYATDYAAAFRHVIQRLRGNGVTNLVSTMCYMAYIPWNVKSWFEALYPGDDVVDWVAWDIYAYSDPGYGYGDFAEMMNRRSGSRPGWPGFYNWAAQTFPDKPLMLGEWGVWHSKRNPGHQAEFFESARLQLELFPRVKSFVYFESPNAEGRDSRVHVTHMGLAAFQELSKHPAFAVAVTRSRP